jgi:hypothetical protein
MLWHRVFYVLLSKDLKSRLFPFFLRFTPTVEFVASTSLIAFTQRTSFRPNSSSTSLCRIKPKHNHWRETITETHEPMTHGSGNFFWGGKTSTISTPAHLHERIYSETWLKTFIWFFFHVFCDRLSYFIRIRLLFFFVFHCLFFCQQESLCSFWRHSTVQL